MDIVSRGIPRPLSEIPRRFMDVGAWNKQDVTFKTAWGACDEDLFNNPTLVQPLTITTLASQIDVMPTMFGLLGWNHDTLGYGHDLLAPSAAARPGRAFVSNYQKLGLKLRKTDPVPGKCDHQLQFDFYTREMLPRLEEARLGERKVFFVDAAHFVLGAFLGLTWCFQRIFLKTSPGRQRYNILGAIDSHNQEFTSIRTTENINTLTIVSLIDLIRTKHPITPISLVMDTPDH